MINGRTSYQAMLLALHGAFALGLLVGYHTRICTFAVWFLTNSLQSRNTLVLHGGDVYTRIVLFWALWMPLGSFFSIDSMLQARRAHKSVYGASEMSYEEKRNQYVVADASTFSIAFQLSIMYIISTVHKNGKEWVSDGTATFYALQLDYFRMPLGEFLLTLHPHLLPYFTFSVWMWERYGSAFFFVPWHIGPLRSFACLGFIILHIGFGSCLRLATFFWYPKLISSPFLVNLLRYLTPLIIRICITAVMPLFPFWFWEECVLRSVRTAQSTNLSLFCIRPAKYGGGKQKVREVAFYEFFAWIAHTFFLLAETKLICCSDHMDLTKRLQKEKQERAAAEGDIEGGVALLSDPPSCCNENTRLLVLDHNGQVHQVRSYDDGTIMLMNILTWIHYLTFPTGCFCCACSVSGLSFDEALCSISGHVPKMDEKKKP